MHCSTGINMSSTTVLLFDCLLLCLLFCVGQSVEPWVVDCPNNTIYNTNSTSGRIYRSNLDFLLSSLISNASRPNGFYSFTAGTLNSPNRAAVYGLFLCQVDVEPNVCQECVATASNISLQRCPNRNIATVVYDNCTLSYSNRSIFSNMDTNNPWYLCNPQNVTDTALFNQVLADTMDQIARNAANNDVSGKKFAVKEANLSTFERRLYALGQCTPDLSSLDCEKCLRIVIAYLPRHCSNRLGGRVHLPCCNVRYETYPFYEISTPPPQPTPNLPPPPPPRSPASRKGIPKSFF